MRRGLLARFVARLHDRGRRAVAASLCEARFSLGSLRRSCARHRSAATALFAFIVRGCGLENGRARLEV